MARALTCPHSKIRDGVANYALPDLLKSKSAKVFSLAILKAIERLGESESEMDAESWRLRGMITMLRAMRDAALPVPGFEFGNRGGEDSRLVAVEHLRAALFHVDDSLKLSALELICCNPKLKEPISAIESELFLECLSSNFKSSSPHFRKRSMDIFRKMFLRARVGAHAARCLLQKQRNLTADDRREKEAMMGVEREMFSTICNSVQSALYPGASFERQIFGLDLFLTASSCWISSQSASMVELTFDPESEQKDKLLFFSPAMVSAILVSLLDRFDFIRQLAMNSLAVFPAPLPGFASVHDALSLIGSAITLMNSHRVREADSGASLMRLAFVKQALLFFGVFFLQCRDVR